VRDQQRLSHSKEIFNLIRSEPAQIAFKRVSRLAGYVIHPFIWAYRSRNTFLSSLPTLVLGKASTKTICSGTL
jgi:hypothetical protein